MHHIRIDKVDFVPDTTCRRGVNPKPVFFESNASVYRSSPMGTIVKRFGFGIMYCLWRIHDGDVIIGGGGFSRIVESGIVS